MFFKNLIKFECNINLKAKLWFKLYSALRGQDMIKMSFRFKFVSIFIKFWQFEVGQTLNLTTLLNWLTCLFSIYRLSHLFPIDIWTAFCGATCKVIYWNYNLLLDFPSVWRLVNRTSHNAGGKSQVQGWTWTSMG